jgi:rhamnosyltransferase
VIGRIKNVLASWPLLIYDNTPNGSEELLKIQGLQDNYLGDGLNHGIGVGLQRLMRQAETNGIEQLLYFDQDTFFTSDSLLWIEEWMQIYTKDLRKYTILNFVGNSPQRDINNACIEKKSLVINSGSLFNVGAALKFGGHNEKYFLECVDYEFCFRLAQQGGVMGAVEGCPDLDHLIEQPLKSINILGREYQFRFYPIHRTMSFIATLLKLATISLIQGPRKYGYIFLRNSLTHFVTQGRSLILNSLKMALR